MITNKEDYISKLREKYTNVGFFRRIFAWKDILDNIIKGISGIEPNTDNNINNIKEKNNDLQIDIKNVRDELYKISLDNQNLMNEVNNFKQKEIEHLTKILTNTNKTNEQTEKMMSIFNKSKIKGQIAEYRLEIALCNQFGENSDYWTKNLSIKNGEFVEFAIKINPADSKWIPIDSKAIVPKVINDEYQIDSSYITQINSQSKKMFKYLHKNNTTDFGILVIPDDYLCVNLYKNYSAEIRKIFSEKNIYIASPNTFMQFLISIQTLSDKMALVNQYNVFFNNIDLFFKHQKYFYQNLSKGYEAIKTAVEKNYLNSEKKFTLLENDYSKRIGRSQTKKIDE